VALNHCDRCGLPVEVRVNPGMYVRDPLEWICLTCAELEAST